MGIINEAFCALCVHRYAITHGARCLHDDKHQGEMHSRCAERRNPPQYIVGTKGGSDNKKTFTSVGGALAILRRRYQRPAGLTLPPAYF